MREFGQDLMTLYGFTKPSNLFVRSVVFVCFIQPFIHSFMLFCTKIMLSAQYFAWDSCWNANLFHRHSANPSPKSKEKHCLKCENVSCHVPCKIHILWKSSNYIFFLVMKERTMGWKQDFLHVFKTINGFCLAEWKSLESRTWWTIFRNIFEHRNVRR